MRNLFLLATILLALIHGCRSDQPIGPPDLLYRQWHLLRTREVTNSDWRYWDTDTFYTVEYRADGILVYQRDGVLTQAGCCRPTKFNRQGDVLNYTDWQLCANAFCATIKRATITQLTETQLELTDGYTVSQYEAAN